MDFVVIKADEVEVYSDASRNYSLGFGGYCQQSWLYGRWDSFVANLQPSIAYLELYAVTAVILTWLDRFRNSKICLFCDNISAVYMINNSS